jgi:hypothetical protein
MYGSVGAARPLASPRRIAQAIVAVAVVMIGVIGLGGTAFAHHPEVTAKVDCKGLVEFTSTAWVGVNDNPDTRVNEREQSRTNPQIKVSYSTGGAWIDLPQKATYAFSKANNFTFTDTLQLASPLPGTVAIKVQAIANWANGTGPGDSRQTAAMTVPRCISAGIGDAVCSSGGSTVHMVNPSNAEVAFTIKKGSATVATVKVAAGREADKLVPLAENETATITVSAPGMETVTKAVERDCLNPGAAIADVVCSEGSATATLDNSGSTVPVTFTVTKNGATVATKEIAAGQTDKVAVAVAEDETATITVTAPGMPDVMKSVTRDCEHPPTPTPTIPDAGTVPGDSAGTTTPDPSVGGVGTWAPAATAAAASAQPQPSPAGTENASAAAAAAPEGVATQVQGVTVARPASASANTSAAASQTGGLAFTGADFARVAILGMMLVSFGFGVVSLMHRRRAEEPIVLAERLRWMK